MTFTEAREALQKGQCIRCELMPEGSYFMEYRRGWGSNTLITVDEYGNLYGGKMDFVSLFWDALQEEYNWEASHAR